MRSRHVSGWEASQVLKTFLERPGTISKSREGPRRSRMGVKSKTTVTILVSVGCVAPYVFIHADDSHAFTPGRIVDERSPSARTAVLAALPGHAQGLGDTRHRQMVDDQPSERPAHRRP